jgi:hypothetical protein
MKRAVVVGIVAVIAVAVGTFFVITFRGHTETDITLAMNGNLCTLAKEADLKVKKGKNVKWKIDNKCSTDQTVAVGDFTLNSAPAGSTCADTPDWPFDPADKPGRVKTIPANRKGDIKLTKADNPTATNREFYFNVCQGGTKVDPRLVIEP